MQITTIIPFFQRTQGLLRRAVESVLAQVDVQPSIIVVDDGSPVCALGELSDLLTDHKNLVLLKQANAGPGAARNRALNNLSDETQFIAFLDSDDIWDCRHLQNARAAFGQGADFYFSDVERPGEQTRFSMPGVIRPNGDPLPEGDHLFRYRGDLFDAILHSTPTGTSGIVYRRAIAPKLRFPEDFDGSEDIPFWMALARAAKCVVYTTRCEALYKGHGVNIAAGATWRDPRALRYIANTARMHRRLPQLFQLTSAQLAWNNRWRAELRQDYARNLLAMMWHNEVIDWRTLNALLGDDPRLLLSIARAVVWAITGR